MQELEELTVFIVIQGDKQKDELRIDGNLETLFSPCLVTHTD